MRIKRAIPYRCCRNSSIMAFQAARYLRSMQMQASLAGKRSISSTTPRNSARSANQKKKGIITGENAPIWMVWGMVGIAVMFAIHTGKQHLAHSPMVSINKKRRESIWEVDNPEHVMANVEKFENKSILRKVGHIQERQTVLSHPDLPDFYSRPRSAETLSSVGVDPSKQ